MYNLYNYLHFEINLSVIRNMSVNMLIQQIYLMQFVNTKHLIIKRKRKRKKKKKNININTNKNYTKKKKKKKKKKIKTKIL